MRSSFMNFDKFQQQLAQKVSRHLGEKKNVLEVILTGQFITEKSKCLAINDGSKHLYIYTKQGSLRALKNSDGKEDYDALRSMNLNILSFEEYPSITCFKHQFS